MSCTSIAENIGYLYSDKDKSDRAKIYKEILGYDYTKPETSTEEVLDKIFNDPLILDTPNYQVHELPNIIRIYSSEGLILESLMSLINLTYGFEIVWKDIDPSIKNIVISINDEANSLLDILKYIEDKVGISITVWPKGSGSTIIMSAGV
jgi:hypothetical protein